MLDGEVGFACRGTDPQQGACQSSGRWMSAVDVLNRDLFSGSQFALEALPQMPVLPSQPALADIVQKAPAG